MGEGKPRHHAKAAIRPLKSAETRSLRKRQLLRSCLAESLEIRRFLSTYTVNSLADDGSGGTDGVMTLRWAIAQASLSSNTDPANTINFDFSSLLAAGVPATITLNGTALELNDQNGTLAINGPTSNPLTIDANGNSGVFVNDAGSTAVINNLTISGGAADMGAGINNSGMLTLCNSTVTGNTASESGGGIGSTTGTLTVSDSSVSNNYAYDGGGICSNSTLNITDATIQNNYAWEGGGIYTSASTTITGSTLSANTALRASTVGAPSLPPQH